MKGLHAFRKDAVCASQDAETLNKTFQIAFEGQH
jgi:hypothetical protein